MRVDKWIWHVRLAKTRSTGTELCHAGHVLVNGDKAKASRELRVGDIVEVQRGQHLRRCKVARLIERRVGAKEAGECYEDMSPPRPPREQAPAPAAVREPGSGRPTKRDRRAIARLRREFF